MHDHSNRVLWDSWMRTRPGDVRRPDQVIVPLAGGWHCQLCGQAVAGDRARHHLEHMLELDAWLAGQEPWSGPKPDSIRRSEDRREWRAQKLEAAVTIGEDPFHWAVERFERVSEKPGDERMRAVKRRRLRHPKEETLARIRALLEQGRSWKAIADELKISDDYTRRLIREIDASRSPK